MMLLCYRWAYFNGGVGLGTASPVQISGAAPGSYQVDLNRWEPWIKLWPIDAAGRPIYDASRAEYLEGNRHVVHRGHLLTAHRDNWGGPFRAIMGWWLLRGLGRDWFGRFMERYGSPFPVGKTNTQDSEAVKFLQDAFSLAVKIGGLVIGQDDAVELKEAVVSGGADGHERWHNVCNGAISRAIVGQDLSASAKPTGLGSGVANMQENVREDIRMFDQQKLGETIEKQAIQRFLDVNGLRGSVRLVWGGLSDDDAAKFADVVLKLSQAGWEPDEEAVTETLPQRLGFNVRRKEAPAGAGDAAPGMGELGDGTGEQKPTKGTKDSEDDTEVETLSVKRHGRLIYFSAGGPRSPADKVADARAEVLTAAYSGAMAPFRTAILESHSKEECLERLKKLYADWKPGRLEEELEAALQICAAKGA